MVIIFVISMGAISQIIFSKKLCLNLFQFYDIEEIGGGGGGGGIKHT